MDFDRAEPTCYKTNFPNANPGKQNAAFSYIHEILRLTYIRGLVLVFGWDFPIAPLLNCNSMRRMLTAFQSSQKNDICAIMVIRCFPVWIVSVNLTVLSLLVYLSNKGIRFYIMHVTKYKKSCYKTLFMLNSTGSKFFPFREVPIRKGDAIAEIHCLFQ